VTRDTTTLIDGHNAIHKLAIASGDHEADRRELLIRVRAIDPSAVVYFDARGAPAGLPDTVREQGVRVHYCRREEADHEILERVRHADRPGGFLVVTGDLELARRVRQVGGDSSSVRDWFEPEVPDDPDEKDAPAGFSESDFDLPKFINLDHPPEEMKE
jgi:predicted RNA-binding protein with PIN domain